MPKAFLQKKQEGIAYAFIIPDLKVGVIDFAMKLTLLKNYS